MQIQISNRDRFSSLPAELLEQVFLDAEADLNLLSMLELWGPKNYLGNVAEEKEVAFARLCVARLAATILCVGPNRPHLELRQIWSQRMENGGLDAFVHLLLLILPYLTSLPLQGYTWSRRRIVDCWDFHFIAFGGDTQRLFQRLTHLDLRSKVHIHDSSNATNLELVDFIRVWRISSLRSLAVDMIESAMDFYPLLHPFYRPLQSDLISLDVTITREGNLRPLLHHAPKLQKLKWTFWLNCDRLYVREGIACDTVRTSLGSYQNTLQELRITPEHGYTSDWRARGVKLQGALGLKTFSSLHILEMPFNMLMGQEEGDGVCLMDALPRTLEHLILIDNPGLRNYGVTWDVISLLKVLRQLLVNLNPENGRP
ncbi:hypothetical protein IFR05_011934 [Cadophora sp. M221]|nr:hypothetical protein IFR05_011934 [Cadophora sp. M221]